MLWNFGGGGICWVFGGFLWFIILLVCLRWDSLVLFFWKIFFFFIKGKFGFFGVCFWVCIGVFFVFFWNMDWFFLCFIFCWRVLDFGDWFNGWFTYGKFLCICGDIFGVCGEFCLEWYVSSGLWGDVYWMFCFVWGKYEEGFVGWL